MKRIVWMLCFQIIFIFNSYSQYNTWVYKASMPTARTFLSGCVLNDKFYVIGGAPSTSATKKVEMYDPQNDLWSTLQDLPLARCYAAVCTFNEKIYVFGGATGMWANSTNSIFVFNLQSNTWSQIADMPYSIGGCGIAVVDSLIYLIGGSLNTSSPPVSTVMSFNPLTENWLQKTDLLSPKNMLSACVVDGKIYAIGGTTENWENVYYKKVEMYDPATDTWTQKTDMPTGRWGMASGVVNGLIFVLGGRYETSISNNEVYDPLLNSWSTITPMQEVKTSPVASVINNKIYVTGGHQQGPPMVILSFLGEFTPEITEVDSDTELLRPTEFSISQNYPNPFNPTTVIQYQVPCISQVVLKIYDILGNEIATLVNEEKSAGNYEVEFNLPAGRQGTSSIKHQPSSGVYFYQLKAGNFIQTMKMILLK
jgi:N-acetylneuraminic acid mutarotase